MERGGCVYIMTNKRQSVLYIGVTSDIVARIWEHKNRAHSGSFTDRYNCGILVYYCFYPHIEEAIAAEKAMKGGNRKSKEALINAMNPEWKDLYDEFLVQ